jgi:hypothetical protein
MQTLQPLYQIAIDPILFNPGIHLGQENEPQKKFCRGKHSETARINASKSIRVFNGLFVAGSKQNGFI